MKKVDRARFFEIQSLLDNIPFTQTEEWLEHCSLGDGLIFMVDDLDNPTICSYGRSYKGRISGRLLFISGEATSNNVSLVQIKDFYKSIIDEGYDVIDVSSLGFYSSSYEIAIRQAGFVRPFISNLCALTIVVNPFDLKPHRSWKRNTKKALEHLSVMEIKEPTLADCKRFSEMFEELRQTKKLSYGVDAESLMKLFLSDKYKMFFAIDKEGSPISGRIIYLSNGRSYDIYAANSDESRTYGASYLLMTGIFEWLKDNNYTSFDFGRIGPGVNSMNSVYDFKKLSGGEVALYNGQWVYHNNKFIEVIQLIREYFFHKKTRF